MDYNATVFLPDDSATARLAKSVAPYLQPGDTILLEGEIGAGKTHFARAVIQALLTSDDRPQIEVPSPTYTLVQTYVAPGIEIWHADLYRLADTSEVAELGLDDAFQSAIVLVEWPDRLEDPPEDALTLRFESKGDGRQATFRSTAPRWSGLDELIRHV